MKIGVLSDTHDKIERTAQAIQMLRDGGAEVLIHCGDISSPDTILLFQDVPTHFTYGNWDRSFILSPAIAAIGASVYPESGDLTLAGKRIGWLHSHRHGQLRRVEQSNDYDFLFYGHTHVAESHKTGKTLVANPGAMQRTAVKTCLLVDLESGSLNTFIVEDS